MICSASWAARTVLLALLAIACAMVIRPPVGHAASSPCSSGVALLIDRSASMVDHDPDGALRLAIAGGLGVAQADDLAVGFADALGAAHAPTGGWDLAAGQAMAGGDRGPTDLDAVLAAASALAPRRLIVVTDAEAQLTHWPQGAPGPVGLLVVGGAPTAKTAAAVRAAGGMVAAIRTAPQAALAAERLCQAPALAAARDLVLVAGLRARTGELRGVRSPSQCQPAAQLQAWCRALTGSGWRIWVPSTSPGGRGSVLDSTGPLAANASALRRWLARGPSAPVAVAGHSMGGLIAHAALRMGARIRALMTVGTPHAGSYGADAYYAARSAASACLVLCPGTSAALLVATVTLRHRFGAALADLTRERRTRQAPLGPPGVPLAAWAGTPSTLPLLPAGVPFAGPTRSDYLAPNDGIVGRGSATGRLAGLVPTLLVDDAPTRHSANVPPRSAPTELGSPAVAEWIDASAERLLAGETHAARTDHWRTARAPSARGMARARGSRSLLGSALAVRPRRASAILQPAGLLVPGETTAAARPGAVVIATAPIGVRCDDTPLAAVEVVPGLWYVEVGAIGCSSLRREEVPVVSGQAAAPAIVVGLAGPLASPPGSDAAPTSDPVAAMPERLSAIRRRRGGWVVTLRLRSPGRPRLTRGSHPVALRQFGGREEWGGGRRWRATLSPRGAGQLTILVHSPSGEPLARQPAPRVGSLTLP